MEKLFAPLGYKLSSERHSLDEMFPDWGESSYYDVTLGATLPLYQVLRHLYVLIPVLDDEKHYWVGDAEVEKLLAKGEGWLAEHPEKAFIAQRYLRHQRSLSRAALRELEDTPEVSETDVIETQGEVKLGLHEQRLERVPGAT